MSEMVDDSGGIVGEGRGSGSGGASGSAAGDVSSADSIRAFRHDCRNALHAILIQVKCAQAALEDADSAAARGHLGAIEQAVFESRQLLDSYVPSVEEG